MIWGPCAKKILVVLMNSALANPQAASSLNLCLFQSMATAFFITLHINLLTNPAGSIFILYRVRTLCTTSTITKTIFFCLNYCNGLLTGLPSF